MLHLNSKLLIGKSSRLSHISTCQTGTGHSSFTSQTRSFTFVLIDDATISPPSSSFLISIFFHQGLQVFFQTMSESLSSSLPQQPPPWVELCPFVVRLPLANCSGTLCMSQVDLSMSWFWSLPKLRIANSILVWNLQIGLLCQPYQS